MAVVEIVLIIAGALLALWGVIRAPKSPIAIDTDGTPYITAAAKRGDEKIPFYRSHYFPAILGILISAGAGIVSAWPVG